MIQFFPFIIALFFATHGLATVQAPDYLFYEGKEYPLQTSPLEHFFEKNSELRPISEVLTSDNCRGYVATFLIKHRLLLLTDIVIIRRDSNEEFGYREMSVLSHVFPSHEQLKLKWYSGLLIVPEFPRTGDLPFTAPPTPDHYLLFKVTNGAVARKVIMTPNEFLSFKKRQFAEYRKSDEYKQKLLELNKWLPEASDDDFAELIFEEGVYIQSAEINLMPQASDLHETTYPQGPT